MKPLHPRTFAALAAILLFSACKKEIDYIGQHYNDLSPYKITTFRYFSPTSGWDTLTFYYDHWGNPTSITRPQPNIGAPDFAFKYDRNHRLTDYLGLFGPGGTAAVFWDKYFYDAKGHITADSLYTLVNIVNGQIGQHAENFVKYLQYDAWDRIVQETMVRQGVSFSTNYVYDSTGDLVARDVQYDHRLNFHRTNKIWMFLDRDYSLNNPFVASSYNAGSLPLHWTVSQESSSDFFLFEDYFTEAYITYEYQ